MQSLVVFLAVVSVACGSYIAQPPHTPALVLDPHGRPLDTAEVINARALHLQAKALEYSPYAHTAVVAPLATAVVAPVAHAAVLPAAVSHQSRVDVRTSPAVVSYGLSSPLWAHSGLGLLGHGHYLKKRSLGHLTYAAPLIAPSAVSHQSRVDVVSSPAVVSHAIATPVLTHAVAAPILAPAAVSHQSRVDYRTSPAVYGPLAISYAAPFAHTYTSPLHYSSALYGHGFHY